MTDQTPITYTVNLRCPECEIVWQEVRMKPLKRKSWKTCPACRKKADGNLFEGERIATEMAATTEKGCFNCKYWGCTHNDLTNKFYKKCSLGYKSLHKDDWQDKTPKIYDITYEQDLCDEWEEDDEHDSDST